MKLIKLNHRYKAFKEHRHKWAFWFKMYSKESAKVERAFSNAYGSKYERNAQWHAAFASRSKATGIKPFYVSFADEQMATMILLQLEQ